MFAPAILIPLTDFAVPCMVHAPAIILPFGTRGISTTDSSMPAFTCRILLHSTLKEDSDATGKH